MSHGIMELEHPKASPAETLRAYKFFSGEPLLARDTANFIVFQIFFVLLYLIIPQPETGANELDSELVDAGTMTVLFGLYIASFRLRTLVTRHRSLVRLRLSIWEREIKAYCASRRLVTASTAIACAAMAAWLSVLLIHVL